MLRKTIQLWGKFLEFAISCLLVLPMALLVLVFVAIVALIIIAL